jgi:hypothetical protein
MTRFRSFAGHVLHVSTMQPHFAKAKSPVRLLNLPRICLIPYNGSDPPIFPDRSLKCPNIYGKPDYNI